MAERPIRLDEFTKSQLEFLSTSPSLAFEEEFLKVAFGELNYQRIDAKIDELTDQDKTQMRRGYYK